MKSIRSRGRIFCGQSVRFESLEGRRFLSATQIDYADFSNTAGLNTSGYNAAALTTGNSLSLTDGAANERRSVLYDQRVPTDSFTEYFVYHATDASANGASGFSIVFDGQSGNSAIGADSLAVEFNFTNPATASGVTYSVVEGGTAGLTTLATNSTVNLHDGNTWYIGLTYDGSQLTCALNRADTDAGGQFYDRFSVPISLSSLLGGHSAYTGFTAATSTDDVSTQAINTWSFSGSSDAPTIVDAPRSAAANNVVDGNRTALSVGATSSTSDALTYDWSVVSQPSGAATPSFAANNSASAANTQITFSKDGTYHLAVTVLDSDGESTTQDVDVVVQQVATSLRITPHAARVHRGKHQQYSVTVLDQFGHSMRDAGDVQWAVQSGSGSIHSNGLFTGKLPGHFIVGLTVDGLTGAVAGTVV